MLSYILPFIFQIVIVVFIHEYGHYYFAKRFGVGVTDFSIGFGKEVFGFNDRTGTRWKFSAIPAGGYVKMFGDESAASTADIDKLTEMSDTDKQRSFHYKSLGQKAAIVAGGPLFNFILTIGIFTYFIFVNGITSTAPIVGEVLEKSAAQEAGLIAGDEILSINDGKIESFQDISLAISTNLGNISKYFSF